ncbi:MAG: HAD family hydrolase [Chloroflexi bacterium]|nr:HAD family hydrolase [Chloroflexota bacterium]
MTDRVLVRAITLDFGNTLVLVDRAGLRDVVGTTASGLVRRGIVHAGTEFAPVWAEERDRQFREEVPQFRETDINQRAVRVLARLRGMDPPLAGERWDDPAAAALVGPDEVAAVVDLYSAAFVGRMAPVADATSTLRRLAGRGFALAILSNWPLAVTIDRFAEAQGWLPYLRSIVVSQRVGLIKPHPAIFRAAEEAIGAAGADILHVGDDWAADVVGASRSGWRTAYVRGRQGDTPLPTSERGDGGEGQIPVRADLEIDELSELDALVGLADT